MLTHLVEQGHKCFTDIPLISPGDNLLLTNTTFSRSLTEQTRICIIITIPDSFVKDEIRAENLKLLGERAAGRIGDIHISTPRFGGPTADESIQYRGQHTGVMALSAEEKSDLEVI